jgi:hypothetical protein
MQHDDEMCYTVLILETSAKGKRLALLEGVFARLCDY